MERIGPGQQHRLDVLLGGALEEVSEVGLVPQLVVGYPIFEMLDRGSNELSVGRSFGNVVDVTVVLGVTDRSPLGTVSNDGQHAETASKSLVDDRVEEAKVGGSAFGRLRVEPVQIDAHPAQPGVARDVQSDGGRLVHVQAELLLREDRLAKQQCRSSRQQQHCAPPLARLLG